MLKKKPLSALIGFALLSAATVQAQTATDKPEDPKELEAVVVTTAPLAKSAEDVMQPAEVLAGKALDERLRGTLGETIGNMPGITTTYFGPGVGRPVIRGLDGARVAVLSDGLGSDDVSSVSQDHAVSIEPFLAEQIEVLKGPATLLYGSGAIGGVVNAVDGRIAERAGVSGLSGRAELRYEAGNEGFTGMGRARYEGEGFAISADGVYRDNGDYDIPGGTLANSFHDTETGAIGASWFGDWGFFGASAARFLNTYGNPAEPGDEEEPGIALDMQQTRYELKGGWNVNGAFFENIKAQFAQTDYRHVELEGDEIGTEFFSDGRQFRLDATHARFGAWQGAFGMQYGQRDFEAIGDEAFVPPTESSNWGVFWLEQGQWDAHKLELGLRHDKVRSEALGLEREFSLNSAAASYKLSINDQWDVSIGLDRAERAPAEEELFADGPHIATQTYEVGDPFLRKEVSNQIEIGLHYHGAWLEASISAYRNRFEDFIYLADTGLIYEEEDSEPELAKAGGRITPKGEFDSLPIRVWTQDDATFRGYEAEATFLLADGDNGRYELSFTADRVRATLQDGSFLPRIPSSRLGMHWRFDTGKLRGGLGLNRTQAQDNTAEFETRTAGFTMIDADLAYRWDSSSDLQWEVFAQGRNLGDQEARLSTSFIKDAVLLPGRNVVMGVRLFF